MSVYGYLYCRTCHVQIWLGKWLRETDNRGFGFWHRGLCAEDASDSPALGRKALRFLARHMNHELAAAAEGELSNMIEGSADYRSVDDEYDEWAQQERGSPIPETLDDLADDGASK
jgi:hypothetical protein